MTVETQTESRLQSLLDLYRKGYRSAVVDQSLGKLIALAVEQTRAELQRLADRLRSFEDEHGVSSGEFYRRFRLGELGDDIDLVEWSVFWEMYQATEQRLDHLIGDRP